MIPTSENQVIYLGDGHTTAFTFNFKILERTDLHLIRVGKDGNETEITTDYYVDMATNTVYYPDYVSGGVEPETDRPPILMEGEKLIVYRNVPITQEIDFPTQWPFDVNEDAHDKSCIIDQQLKGEVDRAIKISRTAVGNEGEVNFNMTFPVAPGKTIRFNEEGNGFVLTDDPADVYAKAEALKGQIEAIKDETQGLASDAQNAAEDAEQAEANTKNYYDELVKKGHMVFNSVAEMKAFNLPINAIVKTAGYYSANDGGGAFYVIKESTDKYAEQLDNGLKAELIIENDIANVKQFGAKDKDINFGLVPLQNAVNGAYIVDFDGIELTLSDTCHISNDTVLRNGTIFMNSSNTVKNVIVIGGNEYPAGSIDFAIEDFKIYSVRDKATVSYSDTELTSNLIFVHSHEKQAVSIRATRCEMWNAEYCIKKDDTTNRQLYIENCNLYNGMTTVYTNGNNAILSNSTFKSPATNRLYHAYYQLVNNWDGNNIKVINCDFIMNNIGKVGYPFQVYTPSSVSIENDVDVQLINVRCLVSNNKLGSLAVYNKCMAMLENCVCGVAYNCMAKNSTVAFFDNAPMFDILLDGCTIKVDTEEEMIAPQTDDTNILIKNSIVYFSVPTTYSVSMLKGKLSFVNCIINATVNVVSIRLKGGTLELLNNVIHRSRNISRLFINASDTCTTLIANNVVDMTDSTFPTNNGNVIISA